MVITMVRKPGFAPGPSPSQGEMLLLHHNPEGKSEGRIRKPEEKQKLEARKFKMANSGFGLRASFGFRPSDFGFSKCALTWTCTTNLRLRRAACRTNYTLRA